MSRLIEQKAPAVCRRLEVSRRDVQATPRDDLVRMLALVYLVRAFEEKVLDLKEADLVHGPAHTSVGQEAVAAAVAVALRKSDLIGSTHRAHGHFLSKAFMYYAPDAFQPLTDPVTATMQTAVNRTLAEIMGLREGWCGGRGGSMHLYDGESGNLGSNAIVGGGIPLATGAAWAQKLQGKDSVVVSFFGDGAINQGCFHEVANMATLWHVPILYLLENNLYAVGTSTEQSSCLPDLAQRTLGYGFDSLIVDGMDPVAMYVAVRETVEALRREPGPCLIEAKTYRFYHHAGRAPGSVYGYRGEDEEKHWRQHDPCNTFPRTLLELNLLTPQENEQLQTLAADVTARAEAFCTAAQSDGQRMIPAAKWPTAASLLEHVRGAEPEPGRSPALQNCIEREDVSDTEPMTYVQAIATATLRAMERDERVIVLGEEVANLGGGAYRATQGIKQVYPERLINTPISETGFVGMAGGAASVGMRPIVEVMFPDFALMASDQLFNQIGKLRHMYGGRIHFPLIVRTRVAAGYGYGGQHSMDPAGLFALFSGWRVVAPSNAFDYIGLFNTALLADDPVLIIEHGKLYGDEDRVPGNTKAYCVAYGQAKLVRAGRDVTVLTYLTGVKKCLQAAQELAAVGIEAEVIDLRTLDYTGMDYATLVASLVKTGSAVIVEEAPRSLGLGARLADELQARCFDHLDAPISHVTAPDVPSPVSRVLEEAFLPSVAQIRSAIERAAKRQV